MYSVHLPTQCFPIQPNWQNWEFLQMLSPIFSLGKFYDLGGKFGFMDFLHFLDFSVSFLNWQNLEFLQILSPILSLHHFHHPNHPSH